MVTAETLSAVDAVAAAVAPESILTCADGTDGAAVTGVLAAIAAAAIASGAVPVPDVGVAAGTSVGATGTGIATATGFGVVTDGASCCVEAAGAVEEPVAAIVSETGFSIVFGAPVFEAPDFAFDR